MKNILGIDRGSAYIKSSENIHFRSLIRGEKNNEIDLKKNKIKICWEGQTYILGEGLGSSDLDKANNKYTDIFICSAIAMSVKEKEITANVITGLPVAQYIKNKDIYKKKFQNQKKMIEIKGELKTIYFENFEVFPESAGVFYNLSVEDALIIDIGGLSVDVVLFINNELVSFETYELGTLNFYSKVSNQINNEFGCKVKTSDVETLMKNNEIYVHGIKRRIEKLKILEEQHVEEILERIKLDFDIKLSPQILVAGGGGAKFIKVIEKFLPEAKLIENPLYANAYGFKKVGQKLWR